MMKKYRLYTVTLIVLLCLASGLIFAQEEPVFAPPTQPLVACPTDAADNAQTSPCDILATKPEDIVGVWTVYFNAEPAFLRYNADGTWLIADTAEHTDGVSYEDYPYGTYSFDEDGVFTTVDPHVPAEVISEECRAGRYLVRVIKVGDQPVALNKAVLEDCFAPRRTDWAYTMLWVGSE